jgi:hypothetical protein
MSDSTCSGCRFWKRIGNTVTGDCSVPLPHWANERLAYPIAVMKESELANKCEAFSEDEEQTNLCSSSLLAPASVS